MKRKIMLELTEAQYRALRGCVNGYTDDLANSGMLNDARKRKVYEALIPKIDKAWKAERQ